MSFCPVDSCYISIIYLIMRMTYFNSDILENSFSGKFNKWISVLPEIIVAVFSCGTEVDVI